MRQLKRKPLPCRTLDGVSSQHGEGRGKRSQLARETTGTGRPPEIVLASREKGHKAHKGQNFLSWEKKTLTLQVQVRRMPGGRTGRFLRKRGRLVAQSVVATKV